MTLSLCFFMIRTEDHEKRANRQFVEIFGVTTAEHSLSSQLSKHLQEQFCRLLEAVLSPLYIQ